MEATENMQNSIEFVDESEVVIEIGEEKSNETDLSKQNALVKTENGGSQGKGISLVESGEAISHLPEACSLQQDSSNIVKRKRGRPKKNASSPHKPAPTSQKPAAASHKPTPSGMTILKPNRGRKPKSYNAKLEPELNTDDLKHLEKPFTYGWKRELVFRNSSGPRSSNHMCDVYYFPPSGKKLRSMVDISTYLMTHKSSEVNLTHFTFRRQPLFKPPYEIVRCAGRPVKNFEQVGVVQTLPVKRKIPAIKQTNPEKQKIPAVVNKGMSKPVKKSFPQLKVTVKRLPCSDTVTQLATAASSSLLSDKETNVNDSELQSATSVGITAAGEPVNHLVTTSQQVKKPGHKRKRQSSPEWTPYSEEHFTLKKPYSKYDEDTSDSEDYYYYDNDNDDGDVDDSDDSSSLQNILGTPSKLIASIVRSEPANAASNLNGNYAALSQDFTVTTPISAESTPTSARLTPTSARLTPISAGLTPISAGLTPLSAGLTPLSARLTPLSAGLTPLSAGLTPLSAGFSLGNRPANPEVIFVTSAVATPGIYSHKCPGMGDVKPCHPCSQCGRLFRFKCSKADPNGALSSVCPKCQRKPKQSSAGVPSNPTVIQLEKPVKIQNLSALPVGLHRMNSVSGPVKIENLPAIPVSLRVDSVSGRVSTSLVPVSSTLINTPLLTTPQLRPRVFFLPRQNVSKFPPPPPLASRPQFETLTLLPISFTSSTPPPPRLQFCNIPQAGQSQVQPPSPLLLSSPVLLSSQANSAISRLPTLQPGRSLLSASSVALQTSETSVAFEDVIDVDSVCINPVTRSPLAPTASLGRSLLTPTGLLAQKHYSSDPTQTSLVTDNNTTNLVFEVNTVQKTFQSVKDTLKDVIHTRQDVSSPDSLVYAHGPQSPEALDASVLGHHQEALDVSVLGHQADKNVLCAVRKLITQRARSESVSSDSFDSLPVQFEPSDADSSLSEQQKVSTHEALDFTKDVDTTRQQLKDQQAGEDKCSTLKGLLRKPPLDFVKEQEVASLVVLDSGSSAHSGLSKVLEKSDATPVTVAATAEEEDMQLVGENCTDVVTATSHKDLLSSLSTLEFTSLPSSSGNASTHNLLDVGALRAVKPDDAACSSGYSSQATEACVRKTAQKMYLSSFKILQGSFPVVMKIFSYLSPADLLRVSAVCKLWHTLARQPSLWKCVRLKGIRVQNWDQAAEFFHKIGVQSLNFTGAISESAWGALSFDQWENIKRTIPTLTQLKELFFEQVPASVLNSLTEKMPHLTNIGAEFINDSEVFTALPAATLDRTVMNMSLAVQAVLSKKLVTKDAARLFCVQEKDLIHLAQAGGKLTADEERAVILCCLRLSHMGFNVQLDTLVGKCQEMFARRYSTTASIPVLDSYVRNLYLCNQPLLTPSVEMSSSSSVQQRLEAHYSVLQKLYKNLWPRLPPSPSQVLVFDLKHFNLGRDRMLNGIQSVSVTVFSTMTANSTCLPAMAVWPRHVEASSTSLFNIVSSRGLAAYYHVYNYIQQILSLVKIRPLVILCNGNASLLSEKLITTCLNEGVYFYCVPPDVARYVFPGFHGGLLHLLKASVPEEGLSCKDFASLLLFLLDKKIKMVQQSAKLAFTATGAFPVNPKAPFQYQTSGSTTWQQPGSLLQSHTMNKLTDVALAAQVQQSPSTCDAVLAETMQSDPASTSVNKNMENVRFPRKSKLKHQDNTESKEEQRGSITRRGRKPKITRRGRKPKQKVESEAAKYKKNKENVKNNNSIVLQDNSVIVINDDVEESSVDTIPKEMLEISVVEHGSHIDTAPATVQEVTFNAVSCDMQVQQDKVSATNNEVQQCSVKAKSIAVKKRQRVAKTVAGVERKKQKRSYLRSLAQMLLDRAKQNISAKTKIRLMSSSNSCAEAENKVTSCDRPASCDDVASQDSATMSPVFSNSSRTNRMPSNQYCNSGRGQTKSQTHLRSKGSGEKEQTKSQTLSDLSSKDIQRNQTKSQTQSDLLSIRSERKRTTSKGSRSSVSTSVTKSDIVLVLQQEASKEVSAAPVLNRLQENSGVQDIVTADKSTGNNKSADTLGASGRESGPRNRTNETKDVGLISEKPKTNSLSEKRHQKANIRNRKTEQEPTPQIENDISSDGDNKIKTKHKKRKKHTVKEKSHSDAVNLSVNNSNTVSENPLTQNEKEDEKMESEEEGADKSTQSVDTSLIDHDYTVRYDGNQSGGNAGVSEDSLDSATELADMPGVEVDLIPSSVQKSEAGKLVVSSDEIIYVAAAEDVAETLVSPSVCAEVSRQSDSSNSSSSCSRCSSGSDSSSDEEELPAAKGDSGNTRKKISSSDNESSKYSDATPEGDAADSSTDSQDNNAESTSNEDGDSSDSEQTSDVDEDEEEEAEDDDSLCQICMRSAPPHSKNEIIDWVDCDQNCGRWFHVICITRSQVKADKKRYVCPSCRNV